MTTKSRFISIGGTVLLIVVGLVLYRLFAGDDGGETRRQNIPLVKLATPQRRTMTATLQFTGDIAAIQEANIFSKVSGNLEAVYANIGTAVRRNQLLALIDTTVLYQQVLQTQATYTNAQVNYDRTKDLFGQNLVAKQDMDNAEATVRIAKANYEVAATQLGYAHIIAPFGGYITKRFLDPGALVTMNNSTLFTLMDLSAMKVLINILEKDIPLITIGKKAIVIVDAYPLKEFEGKVSRFSQAVDMSTRTMAVEIDIPNKDTLLKPGMFANVTLTVDRHENAITIPTEALLRDDGGEYVFAASGATAKKIRVTTGIVEGDNTEIVGGLTGEETIIVTGQQSVRDGGRISIQ